MTKLIVAAFAAISLLGCATLKNGASAAGSAVVACGESDASTLFSQVGTIIAQNGANLEAALTALAAQVGVDAVRCAVQAAEAFAGQLGSGSTAPATASLSSSGLARAKAWAASAK